MSGLYPDALLVGTSSSTWAISDCTTGGNDVTSVSLYSQGLKAFGMQQVPRTKTRVYSEWCADQMKAVGVDYLFQPSATITMKQLAEERRQQQAATGLGAAPAAQAAAQAAAQGTPPPPPLLPGSTAVRQRRRRSAQ
jgi:hypothetical protein